MPNTKRERNYLKDMTLADARLWFRYRCQIIDNIKGNRSSQWRNDMACRHCTSGENETQDHLERCSYFNTKREGLDLTIRMQKVIFWRRVTRTLKDLYVNNKDNVNNNTHIILPEQGDIGNYTGNCVSQPNPNGLKRSCVAISARDISVGEMIDDHPP